MSYQWVLRKRFLRARAGSPRWMFAIFGLIMVPPRTRGFTLETPQDHRRHVGSSAHARVHPDRAIWCATTDWFRRARAGSPDYTGYQTYAVRVPPRTRGFTPECGERSDQKKGSSAHARVHPRRPSPNCGRNWFLRARAGSPGMFRPEVAWSKVPPRTRGFTRRERDHHQGPAGSSAHARVFG